MIPRCLCFPIRGGLYSRRLLLAAALPFMFSAAPLSAAVKPHGLFADNMVLQRDIEVPVYGTADNGEKVTVEMNGQTATTTAENGCWKVFLKPMKAGGPYTLTITGKNRVEVKNVLVGDVWICGGQSNMGTTVDFYKKKYADMYADIPGNYVNDNIRLFTMEVIAADSPKNDITMRPDYNSKWAVCNPESALRLSALAYFFAKKVQAETGVPIGLIVSSYGGTGAECWISKEKLASRPEFKSIIDSYQEAVTALEKGRVKNKKDPMGPTNVRRPSGLYYGMICPLEEFAIKGFIWYQGSNNLKRPIQYRTLFPAVIENWRDDWKWQKTGDIPFIFAQVANYGEIPAAPEDVEASYLREAQAMALSLTNTAMAVAIDCGIADNRHFPNKPLLGNRLALLALKVAYGRDVNAYGPVYKDIRIEGNQAFIQFENAGRGLVAKDVQLNNQHLQADLLKGFAICGADEKFVWADARIVSPDTVVVSSPSVSTPVAVRYAWGDFPLCNLYNKEDMPTTPFRTDSFPPPFAEKVDFTPL